MSEQEKIPKQLETLLDRAYNENTEQVSAPSSELGRIQIDFIIREAYLEGVQDAVNAIQKDYEDD